MPAGSGLDAVRLDRRLRPFGARLGVPLAARVVRGLRGGFQWDREDSDTKDWYPQGIDGRGHVLLVSWYSKRTGAARLSVVDTDAGRYGHVALVTTDGKPVKTHAGGLAWREDILYVADTTRGLRLFDLDRFAGDTLPQAGWYRPAGAALRFSFASVDEAAGGLLVGEYTDKVPGARLVRWPFAPGGLLAQEAASDAWVTAHANLQGAVVLAGQLLMAASRGPIREGKLTTSPFAEAPSTGAGRSAARTSRPSAARSSRSPSTPTCRGRWPRRADRVQGRRALADRDDLQPPLAARRGHDGDVAAAAGRRARWPSATRPTACRRSPRPRGPRRACRSRACRVASSSSSTVEPNPITSPCAASTTRASPSRWRSCRIFVSSRAWAFLASWYSAFSLRSPKPRAVLISSAIATRAGPFERGDLGAQRLEPCGGHLVFHHPQPTVDADPIQRANGLRRDRRRRRPRRASSPPPSWRTPAGGSSSSTRSPRPRSAARRSGRSAG